MAQSSPVPVRYPSGVSTDFPFGPLANFGLPNQFKYHNWFDDFCALAAAYPYTQTVTNAGTIALTAGDGGLALFTTAAGASDLCSIQLPVAQFVLTAVKKAFFLVRLKVSSAANAAFNVGLTQTTTTPFTVTDGIWFNKATGSAANLALKYAVGSSATSIVVPTGAYTLADATFIDLGWFLDRNQNLYGFVGSDLVAYQSQNTAQAGPMCGASGITPPTANLNLTVAIQSGTGTAKTATVDFVMAAVER